MIPHGEEKTKNWSDEEKAKKLPGIAGIDTTILLIVWYSIQHNLQLPINISFFLIFGAILPDIIQGVYLALTEHPGNHKYTQIHYRIHHLLSKNLLSMKIGIFIQLFTLITSIYLITLLYK